MRAGVLIAAGTVVSLLACSEAPLNPPQAVSLTPSFSAGGQAACPLTADVIVSSESELLAALASAPPGSTIGVRGIIQVTADVVETTPNITLTCAAAGSGISAQSGGAVVELLTVAGNGVTVDRLMLDGSNAVDPFVAQDVSGARFTNNTVICSPGAVGGSCAFFSGTAGVVVSGNEFRSDGAYTGLHMQLGIDGAQILNNTLKTTAPSVGPVFGALRIRDGTNVVISGNTVQGPWVSSAALVDLASSTIERNTFTGAAIYGIRARSGAPSLTGRTMTDDVFRNNQISGAGTAGILLISGCTNQFFGNNLNGNAGDVGAIFDVSTGGNTLVGNKNVVFDNGGTVDCNGDGVPDPNVITGIGRVKKGTPPGDPPAPDNTASISRAVPLR